MNALHPTNALFKFNSAVSETFPVQLNGKYKKLLKKSCVKCGWRGGVEV